MKFLKKVLRIFKSPQNSLDQAWEYYDEKNYLSALECLKSSIGEEDGATLHLLGEMHSGGHGVIQGFEKAELLWTKGAEKGDFGCQVALSHIYYDSTYEPASLNDFVKAYAWTNVALAAPAPRNPRILSKFKRIDVLLERMRQDLLERMTREQIRQAQELSNTLSKRILENKQAEQ